MLGHWKRPGIWLTSSCQQPCPPPGQSRRTTAARCQTGAVPRDGRVNVACRSSGGRCSRSWPSRPFCHSGSSGPIRHFKTRPSTCGQGTWNGRGGCTKRRSRTFPRTSPGHPSSTRHSAPWRTVSEVWPPRASSRSASCSGSPAFCGPRRRGCTGSGQHCWRRGCSLPWPARSSWAPSRPLTRWRCSCWLWPHGWVSGLRTASSGHGQLFSSPLASPWPRLTPPSTQRFCLPR